MDTLSVYGPGVTGVSSLWSTSALFKKKKYGTGLSANTTLPEDIAKMLGEAEQQFMSGDNAGSIAILSQVTSRAPRLPQPYSILALIYEQSGDNNHALQLYALAAAFSKKNLELWRKVLVFAMQIGEYQQASAALNRCIKLSPVGETQQEYLQMRVVLFAIQGKYRASKQLLKAYMGKFPTDVLTLVQYGEALYEQGLLPAAAASFEQFLSNCYLTKDTFDDLVTASSERLEWLIANNGLIFYVIRLHSTVLLEENHIRDCIFLLEGTITLFQCLQSNASLENLDQLPTSFPLELMLQLGHARLKLSMEISDEKVVDEALAVLNPVFVSLFGDSTRWVDSLLIHPPDSTNDYDTVITTKEPLVDMKQVELTSFILETCAFIASRMLIHGMKVKSRKILDFALQLTFDMLDIITEGVRGQCLLILAKVAKEFELQEEYEKLLLEAIRRSPFLGDAIQLHVVEVLDHRHDLLYDTIDATYRYSMLLIHEWEEVEKFLFLSTKQQMLSGLTPSQGMIVDGDEDVESDLDQDEDDEEDNMDDADYEPPLPDETATGGGETQTETEQQQDPDLNIFIQKANLLAAGFIGMDDPSFISSFPLPKAAADSGDPSSSATAAAQQSSSSAAQQQPQQAQVMLYLGKSSFTPLHSRHEVNRQVLSDLLQVLCAHTFMLAKSPHSHPLATVYLPALGTSLLHAYLRVLTVRIKKREVVSLRFLMKRYHELRGELKSRPQAFALITLENNMINGDSFSVSELLKINDTKLDFYVLISLLTEFIPLETIVDDHFIQEIANTLIPIFETTLHHNHEEVDKLKLEVGQLANIQMNLNIRRRRNEYSVLDLPPEDVAQQSGGTGSGGRATMKIGKRSLFTRDAFLEAAEQISSETKLAASKLWENPLDISAANYLFRLVVADGHQQSSEKQSIFLENRLPVRSLLEEHLKMIEQQQKQMNVTVKKENIIQPSAAAYLLTGHDAAIFKRHHEVIDHYLMAFLLQADDVHGGQQPLVALSLASYLIMLSSHTLIKSRYDNLLRGMIFLHVYQKQRLQRSTSGNQQREMEKYQEVLYNLARVFEELKLNYLAVSTYQKALTLDSDVGTLRLTREAAHNLAQLYRADGAKDLAVSIMARYLTFD